MNWLISLFIGVVVGYFLRELELRYNLFGQLHTKKVKDKDSEDLKWKPN